MFLKEEAKAESVITEEISEVKEKVCLFFGNFVKNLV